MAFMPPGAVKNRRPFSTMTSGARSRNFLSKRVSQRSAGSKTCESAEIIGVACIAFFLLALPNGWPAPTNITQMGRRVKQDSCYPSF